MFDVQTKSLKPAFWIEGKPLSSANEKPQRRWRVDADVEFWRTAVHHQLQLSIPQLREQVDIAFQAFGMEQFVFFTYVFSIIN